MSEIDPLEALRLPAEPVEPAPEFRARLRSRVADRRGILPTIALPDRSTEMTLQEPTDRSELARINGRIWPAVLAGDAPALIRTVVDVFGFIEQFVVHGEEPGVVEHSQIVWPEGGVVQIGTANRPGRTFSDRPIGGASIYVVTDDPAAVYRRCVDAGLEIVVPLEEPAYDPGGSGFGVRDPEGNLWSFGTYAGEPHHAQA